jgi:hypothetical protein
MRTLKPEVSWVQCYIGVAGTTRTGRTRKARRQDNRCACLTPPFFGGVRLCLTLKPVAQCILVSALETTFFALTLARFDQMFQAS